MSVDPQVQALIIRRLRQLKKVKYAPSQEAIIEYVRERLEIPAEDVRRQIDLTVASGEITERAPTSTKPYISYTFPPGKEHTSPLNKSPSPKMPKKRWIPNLRSPPSGVRSPPSSSFKSPGDIRRFLTPKTAGTNVGASKNDNSNGTPTKKSPLKSSASRNDIRPEMVIEDDKDMTKQIKTALIRMERPYGSSVKVLMNYFDARFKVLAPGRGEEREANIHRSLLKWCNIGVRRGILAKVDRMFRVAPLHYYKPAPEGPITEKLKSAFETIRKEKERLKKAANPSLLCSFCVKPESENRDGKAEPMVACVTCGNAGHPSCLKFSDELTKKVRSLSSWECLDCKWCSVCREAGNESMLFCDVCDRGYHLECCEPALSKPPKGDWACLLCLFEKFDEAEQAKYLEQHKLPHRRPSAYSPEKLKKSAQRKSSLESPKRGRPRKEGTNPSNSAESSSEDEDDLPLRSSSAETGSPSGKRRSRGGDELSNLVDPLSKFFTPSNKRQSSVARKSFESLVALARERKQQKNNRQAADKLVKRSRKELNKNSLHEKIKREAKQRKLSEDSVADRTMTDDSLPEHCNATDLEWFRKSEQEAKLAIGAAATVSEELVDCGRYPPFIVFGRFQIQTWYSAPYPQEYARLPKLWICEFCLQYAKSRSVLERHMVKCDLRSPPGDEIYRNGNLSVYEVDGQTSKLYCQNLCLLAKLFLDHKTLYYDVEPFLFYVLTVNDQYGSHLAGYFSKEKHCAQKYNVSCIMILPTYQKAGYGRFLISFSYLLSRHEKQPGTPERPLSELGRMAYQAYWRDQVLDYLVKNPDTPALVIHDISSRTGMSPHDIAATMQELGLVRTASDGSDRLVVVVDEAQLRDYRDKLARKPPIATLEPNALKWIPPPCTQQSSNTQLAPPPMHNEYIEQLKANPPAPPTTERKRRKRKRKMSPWRRQRQLTIAARKKRQLLSQSKNEEEDGDEDEEGEESGEKGDGNSDDSSEAEKPETKKAKRQSRSRNRTTTPRKAEQSDSESGEESGKDSDADSDNDGEDSDEDDDDSSDKGGKKRGGGRKKDRDDKDDNSQDGSSGSQNGDSNAGSSSSNSGGSSENGGSSSNSGQNSSTTNGYETASDASNPTAPVPEDHGSVLKPSQDQSNLRSKRSSTANKTAVSSRTVPRASRAKVAPKQSNVKTVDVKSKENMIDQGIVLASETETEDSLTRLRRPSSSQASTSSLAMAVVDNSMVSHSTVATNSLYVPTSTRPLPSTKEVNRSRRSGLKTHRVQSVLNPQDASTSHQRRTGPVPRPAGMSAPLSQPIIAAGTLLTTPVVDPIVAAVTAQPASMNNHNDVVHEDLMAEFAMPTKYPVPVVAPPSQPVPTAPVSNSIAATGIQSKVDAAIANYQKEKEVAFADLASKPSNLPSFTSSSLPSSFFPSAIDLGLSMDMEVDDMTMPRGPSATVATYVNPSSETQMQSHLSKFATLKPTTPPKAGALTGTTLAQGLVPQAVNKTVSAVAASLGMPTRPHSAQGSLAPIPNHLAGNNFPMANAYAPMSPAPAPTHLNAGYNNPSFYANMMGQVGTGSQPSPPIYPPQSSSVPPNLPVGAPNYYYAAFQQPMAGNFDLAAAAASLMHQQHQQPQQQQQQQQHQQFYQVPLKNFPSNQMYPYAFAQQPPGLSPQPAAAAVYQALGGIHYQQQPAYAPQHFNGTPTNQGHQKWM